MMRADSGLRILALDPSTKGVGFAVIEGSEHLIDWGLKIVRGDKNRECLNRVARLIDCYSPDVVIVEDPQHKSSRRTPRVRMLLKAILALASKKKVKARTVSRLAIKKAFSQDSALTKHQIAIEIARRCQSLLQDCLVCASLG